MTPGSFPTFTDTQVSALEKLYPARCIREGEPIERHLRYAGMVELVHLLRQNVIDGPSSLAFTADEEEAIDMEVEQAATQQQGDH